MLFIAKVEINRVVEIPVCATSEAEALAYLAENSEWKEDGTIDCEDEEAIRAVGVVQVTNPEQSPFETDVLCWGPDVDDTSVCEAFVQDGVAYPKEGEEDDKVWSDYFDEIIYRKKAMEKIWKVKTP